SRRYADHLLSGAGRADGRWTSRQREDRFDRENLERAGDRRVARRDGARREAGRLPHLLGARERGLAQPAPHHGRVDSLHDRGGSRRVVLTLTTNGTRQRAELERLAPAFRNFIVSVSIDGHGPLFEYLRSGAKWTELVQNLDWLVRVPHVRTIVSPTMQNTN